MGGVGFSELLLLALIALLVVGPRRLPEIARAAGQLSRTARSAWQSLKSEFQAELDQEHNRRILAAESEASTKRDTESPDQVAAEDAEPDAEGEESDSDRTDRN